MKWVEVAHAIRDTQRVRNHLRFRVRQAARISSRLNHAVRGWLCAHGIPLAANDRRIRDLRDRHCGRRAVIIGAGPSLRVSDLDRLQSEITFASNKIYLAFDDTPWRPTYYSVTDVLVAENNRKSIANLALAKVFGDSTKAAARGARDVIWIHELGNAEARPGRSFSTDLCRGVWGGCSVIYIQLQIAFFMGIREVYLIGVDFDFSIPKSTGENCVHGEILESEGEVNHFHPDYRKPGERWTMPLLDDQRRAFTYAKNAFESAGGTVVNCSRRTKLDVYERQDFDRVFPL